MLAVCPIPIHILICKSCFFAIERLLLGLSNLQENRGGNYTNFRSGLFVFGEKFEYFEEGSIICHNIKQYKVSYILENQKQKHNKTKY